MLFSHIWLSIWLMQLPFMFFAIDDSKSSWCISNEGGKFCNRKILYVRCGLLHCSLDTVGSKSLHTATKQLLHEMGIFTEHEMRYLFYLFLLYFRELKSCPTLVHLFSPTLNSGSFAALCAKKLWKSQWRTNSIQLKTFDVFYLYSKYPHFM